MITVTVTKVNKRRVLKKILTPTEKLKQLPRKNHLRKRCAICGSKNEIMYSSMIVKKKRIYICDSDCDLKSPYPRRP